MSNPRNIPRLAERFKALSNRHRLEIYLRLLECCPPDSACAVKGEGAPCVGALGERLHLAPSTVSHHLKELHRAGLIRMERRGQMVFCTVDPEGLAEVARLFSEVAAA